MGTSQPSAGFRCNLCGLRNPVSPGADREAAGCTGCRSSIRFRSIILALSRKLFGHDLALTEFPVLKSLRGMGFSDSETNRKLLEQHFTYTNTHFGAEPHFDLLNPDRAEFGEYDFVICSEVLEHVANPIEVAFDSLASLLKPEGFLVLSVPFGPMAETEEHFPDARASALVEVGGKTVLVARNTAGDFAVFDSLTFHFGHGATLERRVFCEDDLRRKLTKAGFTDAQFLTRSSPEFGVELERDCSVPILASKAAFALPCRGVEELMQQFLKQKRILQMADESRWVRLGRKFGVGPRW